MDLKAWVSANPDIVVYVALLVLVTWLLQRKRGQELSDLSEDLAVQDTAVQKAAQARLTALSGVDDRPPSDPGSQAKIPMPPVPPPPGPAPAQGALVDDGDERQAPVNPVLTQYTAGDGQGVAEIERMLEKDPTNLQLLDWLAFMYYSNNETLKAIETYSRIIAIDGENPSQHYYLANSFYKANRVEDALAHWRRVLQIKPDGKLAKKAQDRIRKVEAALGP